MLKRALPPVHPGEILKEMYLDPLNIGVTELAENIGVVRRTVSLLINKHSGVSAEMALRLGIAFDTTPQYWLNMQQSYDLWNAEKRVSLKGIKLLTPSKAQPSAEKIKRKASTTVATATKRRTGAGIRA